MHRLLLSFGVFVATTLIAEPTAQTRILIIGGDFHLSDQPTTASSAPEERSQRLTHCASSPTFPLSRGAVLTVSEPVGSFGSRKNP